MTGLPNAVPSTLNLTVPVGAAPLDEVTLTVNCCWAFRNQSLNLPRAP